MFSRIESLQTKAKTALKASAAGHGAADDVVATLSDVRKKVRTRSLSMVVPFPTYSTTCKPSQHVPSLAQGCNNHRVGQ